MTIKAEPFESRADVQPELAIALQIVSRGGLAVQIGGIHRFSLKEHSLEKIVDEVVDAKFRWRDVKFGKMKSALTIAVDQAQMALIFVLDPSLEAVFSDSLPPFFAGNSSSKVGLCNGRTWDAGAGEAGPRVGSLITDLGRCDGEGMVSFNMALDNVGVVGDTGEHYRTPVIIDPDLPWPPTGGGMGGGPP
jgi:hypothetical protein